MMGALLVDELPLPSATAPSASDARSTVPVTSATIRVFHDLPRVDGVGVGAVDAWVTLRVASHWVPFQSHCPSGETWLDQLFSPAAPCRTGAAAGTHWVPFQNHRPSGESLFVIVALSQWGGPRSDWDPDG